MNTKQNDSVEHEWMRGKCVKCGASIEQEQSVSVGEPVAHINQDGVIHEAGYPWGIHNTLEPLYRHQPQQRTWVGLTDEEIRKASLEAGMQEHYMGFHSGFIRFAQSIEAKLKEKNT